MTHALTYVEIDIPAFVQNSPPDSPVPEETFRFAIDADYLPNSIDAIPSLKSVEISPSIVSLGENLGQRATVTCRFKDHRHIFNGEEFTSGTFWGKFRARYGLRLRGYPLRVIHGSLGDELEEMETRRFVIESSDGPTTDGEYRIIAKDVLKLADGDRAQGPVLSSGFLSATVLVGAVSATLAPTGIGNEEYPASGYAAIGGKEIVAFTRAGDVLTITRAQFNTVAQEHAAQDRVQLCLEYSGDDVADIIYDLLTTYAGVDPDFISLSNWQDETGAFLNTVYSALIAEPRGVDKLVSELIEQAGLILWWDDINQLIKLQVIRPISTALATYDPDNTMMGTLEVNEQPEKRISQVYFYFAKINPLVNEDQINNYRSAALVIDEQGETDYGGSVVKKIFSRWVAVGGRTVAELAASNLLSRFRDPPRRIAFSTMRNEDATAPILGGGYEIEGWPFQDTTGASEAVPIQLTRIKPEAAKFDVEGEEMLFASIGVGPSSPDLHVLVIDANVNNIDMRDVHDAIYTAPTSGLTVTLTIYSGVIVGSSSASTPAFDVGDWPAGVTLNVIVNGRIQGCGGAGGLGGAASFASGNGGAAGVGGGTALYTREAINLTSTNGEIWGGGGGGGGGGAFTDGSSWAAGGNGGGGGAGTLAGNGGVGGFGSGDGETPATGAAGTAGTSETGGVGTAPGFLAGGAGGGPGLAGSSGTSSTFSAGVAGAAGRAIDGDSLVTDIGGVGSIIGGQVN